MRREYAVAGRDGRRSPSASSDACRARRASESRPDSTGCDAIEGSSRLAAPRNVNACGQGCRPRIRLWMRAAGQRPVDRRRRPWSAVARRSRRASSCGVSRRAARAPVDRASTTSRSRAESREVALDLVARLVRADRPMHRRQHRPGVERLHDAHDRDAGLALAGDDRAVDRRRAPVARQQRRVDVDHAEARHGQERVGQDLAVRGDDAEVGAPGARARRETPDPSARPAAAPAARPRRRAP